MSGKIVYLTFLLSLVEIYSFNMGGFIWYAFFARNTIKETPSKSDIKLKKIKTLFGPSQNRDDFALSFFNWGRNHSNWEYSIIKTEIGKFCSSCIFTLDNYFCQEKFHLNAFTQLNTLRGCTSLSPRHQCWSCKN